ncbi:hypothetical protein QBC38DRAFT_454589 [Podospora fimiseda]|uniref:DUF676 domain-containing protein n=1 Tax=Podospora fimiseda TaxID=252190 RepID=A0AAN7H3D7_9PEZI|nr:hypothetical protein QBC38DRAFT_454589 [Podospora fimiseda]
MEPKNTTTTSDLKILVNPEPAKFAQGELIDIVAVHGLGGSALKTWSSKPFGLYGKSTLWLRDLLPAKIPNVRVMSLQYDSSVFGRSAQAIRDNARKLLQLLYNQREDNRDAQKRPIVFIGHSLGGLLIKQALKLANQNTKFRDISTSTKGIIFFGTPHRGSDKAAWLKLLTEVSSTVSNRPDPTFVKDLQTNSETLLKISQDFQPLVKDYAIVSFYEEHEHRMLGTVVVDKLSAVMGLPHEEAMMLTGDHSGMCKLTGMNDPRFDPIWRAIRRASRGRMYTN